jgi:hypothetical protein
MTYETAYKIIKKKIMEEKSNTELLLELIKIESDLKENNHNYDNGNDNWPPDSTTILD